MASKLYNLVRVTTPTVGTGTMTLGSAISGYLTFALAGAADNDVVNYAILDGANTEVGSGTYNVAGPTLTRTPTKSTNANALISLSGGAQVAITPRAETFVDASFPTTGNLAVARMALLLAAQNLYTAQQSVTVATLTDAATVAWDVSIAQKARVTLGGNRLFGAVTNAIEGTTYSLWIYQDATGTRVPTWTTTGAGSFDFGAAGAPVLSTLPSKADLLYFESVSIAATLKLRFCGIQKGFA